MASLTIPLSLEFCQVMAMAVTKANAIYLQIALYKKGFKFTLEGKDFHFRSVMPYKLPLDDEQEGFAFTINAQDFKNAILPATKAKSKDENCATMTMHPNQVQIDVGRLHVALDILQSNSEVKALTFTNVIELPGTIIESLKALSPLVEGNNAIIIGKGSHIYTSDRKFAYKAKVKAKDLDFILPAKAIGLLSFLPNKTPVVKATKEGVLTITFDGKWCVVLPMQQSAEITLEALESLFANNATFSGKAAKLEVLLDAVNVILPYSKFAFYKDGHLASLDENEKTKAKVKVSLPFKEVKGFEVKPLQALARVLHSEEVLEGAEVGLSATSGNLLVAAKDILFFQGVKS